MSEQKTATSLKAPPQKPSEEASKLPPQRGFGIGCPHCGAWPHRITLVVSDVALLKCRRCRRTITPQDLEDAIREHQNLLAWMKAAPIVEKPEGGQGSPQAG